MGRHRRRRRIEAIIPVRAACAGAVAFGLVQLSGVAQAAPLPIPELPGLPGVPGTAPPTPTPAPDPGAQPAPAPAPPEQGPPVDEQDEPDAPCAATARACVSLSRNLAWLMDHGTVVLGPVPITSGRPGYPTPTGVMHVQYKDRNHRSHEFHNAPMPYSVFFAPGDAFHEGSLEEASHGCIHLSHEAAVRFFDFLRRGDVVQILP